VRDRETYQNQVISVAETECGAVVRSVYPSLSLAPDSSHRGGARCLHTSPAPHCVCTHFSCALNQVVRPPSPLQRHKLLNPVLSAMPGEWKCVDDQSHWRDAVGNCHWVGGVVKRGTNDK